MSSSAMPTADGLVGTFKASPLQEYVAGGNSTPTDRRGRGFKVVAIPIGWVAVEVYPVVKRVVLKVYQLSVKVMLTIADESISYGKSLNHTFKASLYGSFTSISEINRTLKGVLKGITVECLEGVYSIAQEVLKGMHYVAKEIKHEIWPFARDAIVLVAKEILSQGISGTHCTLKSFKHLQNCSLEIIQRANEVVGPIVTEILTFARSSLSQAISGLSVAISAFKEVLIPLLDILHATLSELFDFAKSFANNLAKGSMAFSNHLVELYHALRDMLKEPLRELSSYCKAGAKEVLKFFQTLVLSLLEVTFFLKEMPARIALMEVASYSRPLANEALKAIVALNMNFKEAAVMAKELVAPGLEEGLSYLHVGIQEALKGIVHGVIYPLLESLYLPLGAVFRVLEECYLMGESATLESSKGVAMALRALNEALFLPKGALKSLLLENGAYLRAAHHEMQKVETLLLNDVPREIKHGIGDPLEEAVIDCIDEYLRWKRNRPLALS